MNDEKKSFSQIAKILYKICRISTHIERDKTRIKKIILKKKFNKFSIILRQNKVCI